MSTQRRAMRLSALLASAALLTSCGILAGGGQDWQVRTEATLNSWIGRPAKELILSWGPPVKTDTDGDNGHVYTWSEYTEPQRTWDGREILRAGYTTTYLFWADQAGTIYSWRYQTQ